MMLNHLGLDCLLPDDDYLIEIKIWSLPLPCIFVDSESRAKAHSQLLVRQRVIFLVAGSSLVALFFCAQAGQGFAGVHKEMSSIFADQ